jgi:predicted amidophosphoribosyltransferase
MSPLVIFVGTLVLLTLIVCATMLFQFRPTRRCPRCESRVDLSRWRCPICGYEFQHVKLLSR